MTIMLQPPIPSFVKQVGRFWCLKYDAWITPAIEKSGNLNWDQTFIPAVERLKERPYSWVVDVGAFVGDTAAWFADRPLVCFEPQRDAFTCLSHNFPDAYNLPFPAGNGELVTPYFEEAGNMGGRWVSVGGNTRTIRLDELELPNVGLIKIDVEGSEPRVLDGAVETIKRCSPIVLVEVNIPALKKQGFAEGDVLNRFEGWKRTELNRSADLYDLMLEKV